MQVLTDAQPVETTVHATKKRRGNEVSVSGETRMLLVYAKPLFFSCREGVAVCTFALLPQN